MSLSLQKLLNNVEQISYACGWHPSLTMMMCAYLKVYQIKFPRAIEKYATHYVLCSAISMTLIQKRTLSLENNGKRAIDTCSTGCKWLCNKCMKRLTIISFRRFIMLFTISAPMT